MPATPISLQQVRVADPCPVSWDSMTGDDKARFCAHCNRHVHNLSAVPEDEAQRLICESGGRLCIAYVPNEQGGVMPLPYAKQKPPRYAWKWVAALCALGGLVSGLASALYHQQPLAAPAPMVRGKMIVGDMVCPSPAVPPATQPAAGAAGAAGVDDSAMSL